MPHQTKTIPALLLFAISAVTIHADPDPNFHCYLLFGQSNMAGGCMTPNPGDCDTTGRIKVLAYTDCNVQSPACSQLILNRTKNQWYTAFPPYHDCDEGIGIADNFARKLLDSIHQDITIGLIPCALSGMSMSVFRKGAVWGGADTIPQWCQKDLNAAKQLAYSWMVDRCKLARQTGVIKGILLHQGESDNNAGWWVDTTKKVLDNLKADLSLPDSIPVLVGELLQEKDINGQTPCCSAHNQKVHQLANEYAHCEYVSSDSLMMRTDDDWQAHFDCPGFKKFGIRYALKLLSMADNAYIPRIPVSIGSEQKITPPAKRFITAATRIFSLDGRAVKPATGTGKATLRNPGVYIVIDKTVNGSRMTMVPFVRD